VKALGLACVEVQVLSGPLVLENIYRVEGEKGDEIIFVFEVAFVTDDYHDTIAFQESHGTATTAKWYDPKQLDRPGYPSLYLEGLKALPTK
jgi:hypothetical protein